MLLACLCQHGETFAMQMRKATTTPKLVMACTCTDDTPPRCNRRCRARVLPRAIGRRPHMCRTVPATAFAAVHACTNTAKALLMQMHNLLRQHQNPDLVVCTAQGIADKPPALQQAARGLPCAMGCSHICIVMPHAPNTPQAAIHTVMIQQ